jgi:hypothetical protein
MVAGDCRRRRKRRTRRRQLSGEPTPTFVLTLWAELTPLVVFKLAAAATDRANIRKTHTLIVPSFDLLTARIKRVSLAFPK